MHRWGHCWKNCYFRRVNLRKSRKGISRRPHPNHQLNQGFRRPNSSTRQRLLRWKRLVRSFGPQIRHRQQHRHRCPRKEDHRIHHSSLPRSPQMARRPQHSMESRKILPSRLRRCRLRPQSVGKHQRRAKPHQQRDPSTRTQRSVRGEQTPRPNHHRPLHRWDNCWKDRRFYWWCFDKGCPRNRHRPPQTQGLNQGFRRPNSSTRQRLLRRKRIIRSFGPQIRHWQQHWQLSPWKKDHFLCHPSLPRSPQMARRPQHSMESRKILPNWLRRCNLRTQSLGKRHRTTKLNWSIDSSASNERRFWAKQASRSNYYHSMHWWWYCQ